MRKVPFTLIAVCPANQPPFPRPSHHATRRRASQPSRSYHGYEAQYFGGVEPREAAGPVHPPGGAWERAVLASSGDGALYSTR